VVLALSTVATIAYAASERYDDAKLNIEKAIALLKAVEYPDQPKAERQRRDQAVKDLEASLVQIERAKAAADAAPAPAKPLPKPVAPKKPAPKKPAP
jgi:hypothetical protein